MIDFVEAGGGYLIQYDGVTGAARVAVGTGGEGLVVRDPSELESAHLPVLVLLNLHRQFAPIDRFTTRKKILRKVWSYMAKMTAEEKQAAKQKAADDKKAAAQVQKDAAAKKKVDAAAAVQAKKDAIAKKKADAEAAKAEKKRLAAEKKTTPKPPLAVARFQNYIIHRTNAEIPQYRGKRGEALAVITDGMTVAQYKEAAKPWGAGLDYLRFYESQGLITMEAPAVPEPVIAAQQ